MNIVLTVNERSQAMLMHDEPLGFVPSWVEFSRDKRGVRIISDLGEEHTAGVFFNDKAWDDLGAIEEILVVYMKDRKPIEGCMVPFINQSYDEAGGEANYG